MKWSASMEVVSRTASPIVLVILARLLCPDDFGVVATAMIAISFAKMFWDAGLSKALVQTEEAKEDAANVVFWSNILLGLLLYGLIFWGAPYVAEFFASPKSKNVLRVLGIQIIIASLSTVQQALFVRELNFRRLFWVKLLTAFFPGLFSIPLAFYGYGVWALVFGTLAGQTLNLILLWVYSPWRPRIAYDTLIARKMFGFGFWVLLESFGAWLITWGDNLIVGKLLGLEDLGVYRTGWSMVTILFGLVLNPFLPVLYPTFSRMQNDIVALKANFHKVNRIVAVLAIPMGVGLLLVGPELAGVLFGDKWHGLGFVLGVLGLMFGLSWLVGVNPHLYRAMGRPDVNSKLIFFQLLYYLPAYWFGAQHGLETFVYIRLGVAVLSMPVHIWLCTRMLNVSPSYLWRDARLAIICTLFMGIGIGIIKWGIQSVAYELPQTLMLGAIVISGVGLYVCFLCFMDRSFVKQTTMLLKRAILT